MNKIYIFLAAMLVMSSHADDRVTVDIYYEALCPACQNFIKTELTPALYVEGFQTIANIRLIPYGNSRIGPDNQAICEHGRNECYGHQLEACALLHLYEQTNLKFVACMENFIESYDEDFDKSWSFCYNNIGVSLNELNAARYCQQGRGQGSYLVVKAGKETEALNPPHKYVPWIVVNGEHTEEIQQQAEQDLVGYVCSLYNGPNKIEACSSITRKFFKMFEFKSIDYCFKN